jgi:hypothetical protein
MRDTHILSSCHRESRTDADQDIIYASVVDVAHAIRSGALSSGEFKVQRAKVSVES